jgi:beta-fructofuranosidase
MQPIALQCDEYGIWSGSIVVDKNNTSGFFPNQTNGVVAIYTQHHLVNRTEEQAIAYSTDGGYTFTKYAKNPVLQFPAGSENFRDPKVIWHCPTQRWVMAVAKTALTTIGIYTSSNLVDWTSVSDFKNQHLVDAGHGFECPNLVPIPRINSTGAEDPNLPTIPGGEIRDFGDYILLASSGGGSPLNGGSVTRYFLGKFNGTHFDPIDNRTDRFIDFGPDNYASQFFFGLPDGAPVVSLGWASNLRYAGSVPTGPREGWRGILTGPREGYLIHDPGEGDLSYFSRPIGLDTLRDQTFADISIQQAVNQSVSYNSSEAVLVEAHLEMQPYDDDSVEINLDFIFKTSLGPEKILCTIIFRTWTADFGCDRSQATLNWTLSDPYQNQMTALRVRPLLPFHNPAVRRWEVQVIMDQSILEVYLNGGVKSGTITMFPSSPLDTVHLRTNKIPIWASLKVKVQGLRAGRSAYFEM